MSRNRGAGSGDGVAVGGGGAHRNSFGGNNSHTSEQLLGGGNAIGSLSQQVNDTINFCTVQLEAVAKKIAKNVEKVEATKVEQLKNEILNATKSLLTAQNKDNLSKAIAEEYLTKEDIPASNETNNNSSSSSSSSSSAAESQSSSNSNRSRGADSVELVETLRKRSTEFKLEVNPTYKRVKDIVHPKAKDDDEDIMLMDAEESEVDYRCPVSSMRYENPMKSTRCIHHLSEASVQLMLRNKTSFRCPVPGCKSNWAKETSSYDKVFEMRMQRFFRTHSATQSQANTATVSEYIDDE